MDNFSYSRPATLRDATAQLGKERGKVALIAGGTDLLGELKDNLAAPERLVSIRHLKELQGIRSARRSDASARATLLADIVESPMVQQQTPLLAMAAGKVGTPQIRNMGTIGGNLCQRPRCWYYRNNYPCFKHGGNACFSATGENDYHAILEGGPSFIVHPSDTAPALVALGATVRIVTAGPRANGPDREVLRDAATGCHAARTCCCRTRSSSEIRGAERTGRVEGNLRQGDGARGLGLRALQRRRDGHGAERRGAGRAHRARRRGARFRTAR